MKKIFKVFGLMFLFVAMASFTLVDSASSSTSKVSPTGVPMVQGYEAVKNGTTVYFNTQLCAIDNGYTLTGNVATLPATHVYTCFS